MANKRMFTMKICDSDAFLDMPLSTQALYFHLNMRADDDGFVGNPKRIQRMIGASEDDLKLLIAKRFLLVFKDGVIVIKHWKMHNCIQGDRYHPTVYQDEFNMLYEKENKSYTLSKTETKCIQNGNKMYTDMETKCIQNGNKMYTDMETKCIQNVSSDLDLDKDLDKEIEKENICASDNAPCKDKKPTKAQINAFFESVWKLYPVKKGKGQISDAKKAKLYYVGYDELSRAIERYKAELEKDADWRKPQNGSTFFNSGYVDYLDVNYQPQERKKAQPKNQYNNQFNNYNQSLSDETIDEFENMYMQEVNERSGS